MPKFDTRLPLIVGSLAAQLLAAAPDLANTGSTQTAAPTPAEAAAPISAPATTPAESSYNLGLVMGAQLEHAGLGTKVVFEELVRGLKQALATKMPTLVQREDATRFMRGARDALAERNRAAAREFLAGNSRVAGVTTTSSGLEYRILAAGDPKAQAAGPNDQVTVQYRASLVDGTEFDSSYARGQPATFKLNGTLKGWREALTLMKPGAKWQLWVPPALGYDAMSPPPIPPGSLLIYELELVKVEPAGQIGGNAPKLQAPKPAAKKSAAPAGAASAPK